MPARRPVCLIGLVVVSFVVSALLLPHSPSVLRESLRSVGPAGPAIALGAWVVLTPALFPGTVMAAAGGMAFGAPAGAALAVGGALVGGLTAFALGRVGARGPVERLVNSRPRLAGIYTLLERRGFAAVLAARLAPGVPACALHYAAGASPVRVRAFAAAMAIGAVVRTAPYALLGDGLASGSRLTLLVAAASIVVGGVAAGMLARQVRRAGVAVS